MVWLYWLWNATYFSFLNSENNFLLIHIIFLGNELKVPSRSGAIFLPFKVYFVIISCKSHATDTPSHKKNVCSFLSPLQYWKNFNASNENSYARHYLWIAKKHLVVKLPLISPLSLKSTKLNLIQLRDEWGDDAIFTLPSPTH